MDGGSIFEKSYSKNYDVDRLSMKISDYMVAFSGLAQNYCVGIVDMMDSTKISSEMNELSWCKYYEIFLNSTAKVLPRFGGKVIKNQGDGLLYYFPESAKSTKFGFMSCIEASLALIEEHDVICEISKKEGVTLLKLPC